MEIYKDENYELIRASQAGDAKAMERLVKIYSEPVYGVIFSILGKRDLLEDTAQETFLRVLSSIKDYEFRAPFRSWVLRIAVNLCRDHIRRARVRNIVSRIQINKETEEEQEFVDFEQDPHVDLERQEKYKYLYEGIGRLPEQLRVVLVLRDIQDLTYEDISGILDWKIGTVKSRLFRARKELADILQPMRKDI